ncbi:MAG TPA: hypothetical protein VGM02_01430 [Acidobacteriaceae bacterium]|jgi:hypothetical protein
MTPEATTTPQEPTAPPEPTTGQAERVAAIFRDMITHLSTLHSGSDKRYASQLAYMDRIILLAGGTLTLTFTVVAAIGSRLSTGHPAQHVHVLIAACWLLVVTITTGLLSTPHIMLARQHAESTSALLIAETQLKLRLLEIPNVMPTTEQLNQISLVKATNVSELHKRSDTLARIFSSVAQLSLLITFIFLVIFIQSNVGLLLGSK